MKGKEAIAGAPEALKRRGLLCPRWMDHCKRENYPLNGIPHYNKLIAHIAPLTPYCSETDRKTHLMRYI